MPRTSRAVEILLVEDNPGDARLTTDLLKEANIKNVVYTVKDGVDALDFLYKRKSYRTAPTPDLILFDLKFPRMGGHEVLERIKNDPDLKCIPVLIFSSSTSEDDIIRANSLHANCFLRKPVSLDGYLKIIDALDNFWLTMVCLSSEV